MQAVKDRIYSLPTAILILTFTLNGLFHLGVNRAAADIEGTFSDLRKLVIVGLAYLLAGGLAVFNWRASVAFLSTSKLLVLFLSYALLSCSWSAVPLKVVINFTHYVGMTLCALVLVIRFYDRPAKILGVVSTAATLSAAISLAAIFLLPAESRHWYTGRWQGLAGNPNTLGVLCAVAVWANVSLLMVKRRILALESFYIIVVVAALLGSRSMTSVMLSVGIIALLIGLRFIKSDSPAVRVGKLMAAGAAVTSGLLVIYSLYPNVFTVGGALGAIGKDTTFTGRTELWMVALNAIQERLAFGWSFDSNISAFSYLGLEETGQFHNGYIDLLVRGGTVSGVLLLVLGATVAGRYLRAGASRYVEAAVFLTVFLAICVHNLTEASFAREGHVLWLLFMVVYFHSKTISIERQ